MPGLKLPIVPLSLPPTIGDLPCDLRDLPHDQEALTVLPFLHSRECATCILQEALGKCGGGTVGSLQLHSVHGNHR